MRGRPVRNCSLVLHTHTLGLGCSLHFVQECLVCSSQKHGLPSGSCILYSCTQEPSMYWECAGAH